MHIYSLYFKYQTHKYKAIFVSHDILNYLYEVLRLPIITYIKKNIIVKAYFYKAFNKYISR